MEVDRWPYSFEPAIWGRTASLRTRHLKHTVLPIRIQRESTHGIRVSWKVGFKLAKKNLSGLVYTTSKAGIVDWARENGWTDEAILKGALSNVYGPNERRKMVVEWADALGREPSEVLRLAQSIALIPTVRHPQPVAGKPRGRVQGK